MILISIFSFIFGVCLGSFASCVGSRIFDEKLSIFGKRSECLKCGHVLGIFDLIPLFSFIFLRGRCRYCKTKLSFIYPLCELSMGLLCFVYVKIFGIYFGLFFTFLFLLFAIQVVSDVRFGLLSDFCSLLIFIFGVIFCFLIKRQIIDILSSYLIILFVVGLAYSLVYFTKKQEPLGFGDVKIFLSIPLFFNTIYILIFLFIASLYVIIFSLAFKKKSVVFMPGIAVSFVITYCMQLFLF